MTGLAWVLARAGGWPRMLLLATCTAVVSGLLLVVVALLRLPADPREALFSLVADQGTRGGTAFATALLTVPALLLLYQAVRLGTAARERRLAALRLAGATPAEVRRLGALEVGIPALAGSVLGIGVYGLLRGVLGGGRLREAWADLDGPRIRLVPTTVAPTWWQVLLVVAGVAVLGVAVGWRASRQVVVSPLGISRRQAPSPPRPWGLLVLVGAVVVSAVAYFAHGALSSAVSQVVGTVVVGMAVVGVIGLASWVAYRVGRFTERRATSPAALLAARRLVTEPRPVGRAAAAVGGIALVSSGASAIAADLVGMRQHVDSFYVVSLGLVAVALLVALLVVTGTLAVHSVESLLDRKRSMAALTALGTPVEELARSQRWEAALVAMPMAVVGVLLGALPLSGVINGSPLGALLMLVNAVVTVGLVWVAITVAVRATRPWVMRATTPDNLRTE